MIKDDFSPYLQGDGLMAPYPVGTPVPFRDCDNGVMYLSEYYIMLHRNHQLTAKDLSDYSNKIAACIGSDGHLHRAPGDPSQDEIDDHLAVLNGHAEFGLKPKFSLPFALYRFPQLVYAWLLAKGVPSILIFPLAWINALIIASSCLIDIYQDETGWHIRQTLKNDAGSRRLNWHLWQATKRKSWLANLAGKFWHWRQKKVYGSDQVMKQIAAIYYQPSGLDNNPYSKYWVD